ncbi:MAG: sugar transferase [Actinomycetales bacterium]|nr:sugar transferase [Actinomycetales bacterium]
MQLNLKRIFDLILATVLLIAAVPLMLLAVALVRLESSGRAIFRQTRIGLNGTPFTLLKFRSMTVPKTTDTEFAPGETVRVTIIGRLLRKTKLDELPQLWNVLVGDMSFVGPRPEVPEWTRVHPELWEIVLSVKPGITDPASIEFRNEEAILATAENAEACYRDVILPRKLQLSAEYVRHRSFLGDLRVLWKTATALVDSRTGDHSKQ